MAQAVVLTKHDFEVRGSCSSNGFAPRPSHKSSYVNVSNPVAQLNDWLAAGWQIQSCTHAGGSSESFPYFLFVLTSSAPSDSEVAIPAPVARGETFLETNGAGLGRRAAVAKELDSAIALLTAQYSSELSQLRVQLAESQLVASKASSRAEQAEQQLGEKLVLARARVGGIAKLARRVRQIK